MKPKVSRSREIITLRAEIASEEKHRRNLTKPQKVFLGKTTKTGNTLA